ncbi:MAG TPA: FHA domain-containing protein [Vicinamibacterales bacterium]|nr:FHA domain-containing protein [Vicinamibacterales bacterium]
MIPGIATGTRFGPYKIVGWIGAGGMGEVYRARYIFCGDVRTSSAASLPAATGAVSCRIIIGDREVGLSQGPHILGRTTEVAIFVDDVGVSRHHARITVESGGAVLEDLGSKNGTILNGCRVAAPTALADGAFIVLGATVLKFRLFAARDRRKPLRSALR